VAAAFEPRADVDRVVDRTIAGNQGGHRVPDDGTEPGRSGTPACQARGLPLAYGTW